MEARAGVTRAIVRVMTDDERTLAAALLGIETRRRRIAGLQTDLANLTLALERFGAECHLRLASLFAELDHLKRSIATTERRILRLRGQDRPKRTPPPEDEPPDPADEAENGPGRFRRRRRGGAPPSAADAETAAELRRLYLELARRCHPDLATDDDDRAHRQEMMLRVNAAYREHDLDQLRWIANEAASADGPPLDSTAARLTWARRELERLDGLVADLRAELANVRQSESGRLWLRRESGEPIFEVMADDLRGEVARQRLRLADLTTIHDRLVRTGRAAKRRAARTA